MKLRFDPDLDYQHEAIGAVVDIFNGQEVCKTNFTVTPLVDELQVSLPGIESDLGVGNNLRLPDDVMFDNVKAIQLRNGLSPSESFDSMNFTVEMETGTGKTYVYLRSILEMNRMYGFTKFIIVVPSIAIKEGVYKAIQITEDHFKGLYDNVQFDYFVYDSQKLGQVSNFATCDYIQIMIINIDAFRRSFKDPEKESKANIIHRPHDRMAGNKPIELVQATNPVVIIDEPQSVDTTEKSKEAIASLNPLVALRYSATHIHKYHMMYKLDSVDAYERRLVKQIEVAGIELEDSHNQAYIRLLKVDNTRSPFRAYVEFDARQKNGEVIRQRKWVHKDDDLLELSGGRGIYEGYILDDIWCEKDNEYISFTSKPEILYLGQALGSVDNDEYKRLQIRRTIEEHLNKELLLKPKGIKVLSLFFIDLVANYRWYDDDNNPQPGKYAQIFEEEYKRAMGKPKYRSLREGKDLDAEAKSVHNGYFAIDKKKDASGVSRFKESSGEGKTQADESAYRLIMQEKEQLLSFDSKLKFIFSHSALREGWDNPNVFQICTLNETKSVIKKRQEIGRGLRIAVNQDGERVHDFDINRLTVIANQSYDSFVSQLQKEIEEEEGIRFGIVERHLFANIPIPSEDGKTVYFGVEASHKVWNYLKDKGYISSSGAVQDSLRIDLKKGTIELPVDIQEHAESIIAVLRKVAGSLNVKNANARKRVKINKRVFLGEEFKSLWNRIKYKTTFRVDFDCDALIAKCAEEIKNTLIVGKARFVTRTATLDIDRGGVRVVGEVPESRTTYEARDYPLPDIVSYLQNDTKLTRRSLVAILKRCGRLEDFKNNPQKFIEEISVIIRHQMSLFIVDGIKYEKIGADVYYAQELFEENELFGYLSKNMVSSKKSVFDYVVYDSGVEEEFAKSFEVNDEVKVYAKLPSWFKINTPLGAYNPDWAVLVEIDGEEHLYFVVESKWSLLTDTLRPTEKGKIDCGREHFKAVDQEVEFTPADNYAAFSRKIASVETARKKK